MTSPSSISIDNPSIFEDFFSLGHQETSSPFLTRTSRRWGSHLFLKTSILSAFLLLFSFLFSFYPLLHPFSAIFLMLVYFFAGIPSLIESIEDLASFQVNIDVLMTLAAFSSVLIGSGLEGGLLLVLFALSGAMEDFVTDKAKGDIQSLHRLAPSKAIVIDQEGVLIERSIKDISIGTKILIQSGQIVPLDGVILEGISSINLVHLTGENLPITKSVGDEVPSGGRNLEGTLTIKVTRTSSDSTLAKIIEMVTQAQEERPILQRWFDRLSKAYAITIIGMSSLFALTFPFLLGIPLLGIEGSVYRALAFLIAASPCALIIAIPIAYLSAIGSCARQGILLKGGLTLDAIASCSAIAFDKTGTLTTGELTFEGINAFDTASISTEEALAIAFALEKNAVHPIAKAITSYGFEKKLFIIPLKDFTAVPGYGLTALLPTYQDRPVYIGKPEYVFPKMKVEWVNKLQEAVKGPKENGELIAILLIDKDLFLMRFKDTVRPNIKSTLEELKRRFHMRLIMLTGDHYPNAKRVAEELGMDHFKADLKPEDKLKYVSEMGQSENLAMIGDGINDAPALARASVGICMGKVGSTAAIDAADAILLHDNIEKLGWLIRKSHQTRAIVAQNLALASLAIIFASIPALAGLVPLWLAVVIHEGGTVIVGLNGLRLLRKK